jgi:hypothetical protein
VSRRRRPRIPGTAGGRGFRVEVATGGDPVGALVRGMRALPVGRGELWDVAIRHDDGCPTLDGGTMLACTCEIVELRGVRVDSKPEAAA